VEREIDSKEMQIDAHRFGSLQTIIQPPCETFVTQTEMVLLNKTWRRYLPSMPPSAQERVPVFSHCAKP